ncbi:MAG: hydrogenase [Treponema sp.]|nr:hydrogenase [Treponema sp.]
MSTLISQPRFSCALAAQQSVLAIPGGIPIIHAGPGCSSKQYIFAATQAGFQGEGYAGGIHVSCTNSSEKEVVFGGEKKLSALIEGTLKVIKGDLYVAMSGCTAGIIGDNASEVADSFAQKGKPVVGVDCAGFRGNSYFGHEVVVNGIIDQYVDSFYQEEGPKVQKGLVNVFASVPYQDVYWRGDLEQIKALLEKLGLKVNILFGYSSAGVSEWKDIPNAQANILVGPWCGKKIVERLKSKYGTPYLQFPYLPVGGKATSAFLRAVAQGLGLDSKLVEGVIKIEEDRFYNYLVSFADFIAEYKGAVPYELYVAGDGLYSLGVADFLSNELGYIPKGVYINDDPPKTSENGIKEAFKQILSEYEEALKFQADGELIVKDIDQKIGNSKKALILGSYWENQLAKKKNEFFVSLSMPVITDVVTNGSYAGYSGGLYLLEKIYANTFRQARSAQNNSGN